jgi:cell division protein FtsB
MKRFFSNIISQLKSGNISILLKNKYYITLIAFFIWMLFFDKNDFISQIKLRAQVYRMEQKKKFYTDKIQQLNQQKQQLFASPASVEKFAREKYYMKKDNEDIYVIVRK